MFRTLALTLPLMLFGALARADSWPSQWRSAVQNGDVAALSTLAIPGRDVDLADRRGRTALMVAAARDDVSLLRKLLDLGANSNRRNSGGGTALMFAAQYDSAAAARLLVERGADADLQAAKDWTAMMIAALKGSDRVMQVLLEAGADPNIPDVQGFTPLMRAVAEDRLGAARRLLSSDRIQVSATDERGISALHLAAAAGRLEITRWLLSGGANKDQQDSEGNTARSLAQSSGHDSVVRLLETWPGATQ